MLPAAHATDGGGSIRIPASACGLFGLKPTRARTPSGPDVGESWNGAGSAHAITRTVRDSAALLDATSGPDPTFQSWQWLYPGLMLIALVLAVNFVGDGLRDALDATSTSDASGSVEKNRSIP